MQSLSRRCGPLLRFRRAQARLQYVTAIGKSNAVSRTLVFCLTTALLISAAHRSPAPISEETPAPEQSAKAKAKHVAKPKPTAQSVSSSTPQPTPKHSVIYTGTWIGPGNQTIVINAAQDTVNITGCWGSIFPASVEADDISWITGIFREHHWTLKPYPDGKSALVTFNGRPIIFRRVN
jgi:hypothetical protein